MKTIICPYCSREFRNIPDHKKVVPHKCIGGFRKNFRKREWTTFYNERNTMDKELIERMKKNMVVFGELGQAEKECLRRVFADNANLIEHRGESSWFPKIGGSLTGSTTYRVHRDYTPEPEVIRCEVYVSEKDGQLYYDHPIRLTCYLHEAIVDKDLIAYEYADGYKGMLPRRNTDYRKSAEYPVAVLFAK